MDLGVWLQTQWNSIPPQAAWLIGLALLLSAGGFVRTVWFISVGYAFSVAAMAVATPLLFMGSLEPLALAHAALLLVYGLRLGTFLVRREIKTNYREAVAADYPGVDDFSFLARLGMWASVALLYLLMFSPCLFAFAFEPTLGGGLGTSLRTAGLSIAAAGLTLEGVADRQKSAFKREHPKQFCQVGLFSWVRCPNYFGEIMVWTGSFIAGIPFYASLTHWLAAITGLVLITLVMIGSTRRLERSQNRRYGELEAYQKYIREVPVLVPFTRIYSLKNARFYLG